MISFQLKRWHSRGYLPHFEGGEICQFLTLRLGDSLPQNVWIKWKTELEQEKDETKKIVLNQRFESYLDEGYGNCFLRDERIASQVQESLLHFDLIRYKLLAWVIMPNHVHFLIKPINNHKISEIIKKLKTFTAHEANKIMNRQGKFWQEDYFDRYIRNYEHFTKTTDYIENNPVKARLCKNYTDWKFSSAYTGSNDS
ncbi:MAG: transposase [Acidobacteriota bacterium]